MSNNENDLDLDLPEETAGSPVQGEKIKEAVAGEDSSAEVQFYASPRRTKTDDKNELDDGESIEFYPADAGGKLSKEEELVGRVLMIVAGSVVILIIAAVLYFALGDDDVEVSPVASVDRTTLVISDEANPEVLTRTRLRQISRYAKAWMIQFGSGFDPKQVTLESLILDMDLNAENLQDGWGNPVVYEPETESFVIRSAGKDGRFDNADDITVNIKM